MRFEKKYIIKKLTQLIDEMKTIPDDEDRGWEWENLLALVSRAKEQVRQAKDKQSTRS